MPTVTDNAICIRRWDYSETSQTASLLLREHGLVRGIIKGAKRAGGAFGGGLDPLTCGEVVAIVKPSRDLATVTAWNVLERYRALRESLPANRAGMYMADLIQHLLLEHDPHPRVFDALRQGLRDLEDAARVPRTLLEYLWTLLGESGYRPELDRDAETAAPLPPDAATLAFSSVAGGVVADTGGADRWRVRRETIELLRAAAAGALPEVDARRLDRANRLLAVYIRELLGREPKTMRWAFPDLPPAPRPPAGRRRGD